MGGTQLALTLRRGDSLAAPICGLAFIFPTLQRLLAYRPEYSLLGFSASHPKFETGSTISIL